MCWQAFERAAIGGGQCGFSERPLYSVMVGGGMAFIPGHEPNIGRTFIDLVGATRIREDDK